MGWGDQRPFPKIRPFWWPAPCLTQEFLPLVRGKEAPTRWFWHQLGFDDWGFDYWNKREIKVRIKRIFWNNSMRYGFGTYCEGHHALFFLGGSTCNKGNGNIYILNKYQALNLLESLHFLTWIVLNVLLSKEMVFLQNFDYFYRLSRIIW